MPKTIQNQPTRLPLLKLSMPVVAAFTAVAWWNAPMPAERPNTEPKDPPPIPNVGRTSDLNTLNTPSTKISYSVGFSHKDFLALNSLRDSIANNLNSNAARKSVITYEPESANYVLKINFELTNTPKETFTDKWQEINNSNSSPAVYHGELEELPTREIYHLKIATLQNKNDAEKAAKNIINKIAPKGLTPSKIQVVEHDGKYSIVYFAASNATLASTQQVLESSIGIKTTPIPDSFLSLSGTNVNTPALTREINTLKPSAHIKPPIPIVKHLPDQGIANTPLESSIENMITNFRATNTLQSQESIVVHVYDINNGSTLVNINGDQPVMTASINKLFVAAAFCYALPEKVESNKGTLSNMLHRSDNYATNILIEALGGSERVQQICAEIGIPVTEIEIIPASGRTLNNRATATQLTNFFKKLNDGSLSGSETIKEIISTNASRVAAGKSGPDHKRGELLGQATEAWNKTGTTLQCIGDSGCIRTSDGREFVITVIVTRNTPSTESMTGMQGRLGGKVLRIIGGQILK